MTERNTIRRYTLTLAIIVTLLAAIPALLAALATPQGGIYLGTQTATDDAMVYSAWMRQAMDGAFLLDNRFTTDAQPGLTIQVYFWVLAQPARLIGIPMTMVLSRLLFGFLFLILLGRTLEKAQVAERTAKWALGFAALGGGIGFLVWETFGLVASPGPLASLLGPFLPVDVWQTEVFLFPSMLVNGLFPASLCLFLLIYQAVLDARESWKPVLPGAAAMLLLMNMHSYDVLLIALVLVGFLVQRLGVKQITGAWAMRSLCIGLGAIPSALWFMRVLQADEVFQARAATLTFAAGPKQLLFGLFPAVLLTGLLVRARWKSDPVLAKAGAAGGALITVLAFFGWSHNPDHYFMSAPVWVFVFAASCAALYFLKIKNAFWGLITSWALVGFVAPYFPGLFQRKLAMALMIPWALLAAKGLAEAIGGMPLERRRMIGGLAGVLACLSSLLWLLRDARFVTANDSSTTVHPVILDPGAVSAIKAIRQSKGDRTVVIAMPGVAARDEENKVILAAPIIPDLNPIVSGLTGAYTYAGHWSETPNYNERRNEVAKVFAPNTSQEERAALLEKIQPDFLLMPNPEQAPDALPDLSYLGKVSQHGSWVLIDRSASQTP